MIQYIVTVKNISRTNGEELLTREKIAANKTSYQIKDLNKGTTYKVELEAATAKGTNSSADPSVFNLDENTLGEYIDLLFPSDSANWKLRDTL